MSFVIVRFVCVDGSQAFAPMSVNLSMCMNVDVTTHDQLMNPQRGHVTGKHALNAADQFRHDPWTRCFISAQKLFQRQLTVTVDLISLCVCVRAISAVDNERFVKFGFHEDPVCVFFIF